MRHAPERRHCAGGVMTSAQATPFAMAAAPDGTENKRPRLTASLRIHSVFPACLVTFGNGRQTAGIPIMRALRSMAVLGRAEGGAERESRVAVTSPAAHGLYAPPNALIRTPTGAPTISGFESPRSSHETTIDAAPLN